MHRKVTVAVMVLSLGGCFILTSQPASAQRSSQHQEKAQGQSRGGGNAVAPRGGGGGAVAPRGGGGSFTPRTVRTAAPPTVRNVDPRPIRAVAPRPVPTITSRPIRTVTPPAIRTVNPRFVAPRGAPRVVTSSGNARVVTAARLRGMPGSGAGRASIRGQNFSVWRSGYRIRRGNGWRTFVGLSTLGAIAVGSSYYYPYAYISAPQPYCDGLTEDGCQLMWQDVETIEGDIVSQCVAYCPWQ